MTNRIIIVDTETTGLDPAVHEIIELHALLCDADTLEIVAEAGGRCPMLRPASASPEALAVNGYTEGRWRGAVTLGVVLLPSLLALVSRAPAWLGSNPGFDVGFIRAACAEHGICTPWEWPALIDTAAEARKRGVHGANGRRGLDALCDALEVDIPGAHTARGDCLRVREVWRRLRETPVPA